MKSSNTALVIIGMLLIVTLPVSVYATGDASKGKEKSQVCQGCHGADGNSYGPEWPNLASQHSTYLVKQIKNFIKRNK